MENVITTDFYIDVSSLKDSEKYYVNNLLKEYTHFLDFVTPKEEFTFTLYYLNTLTIVSFISINQASDVGDRLKLKNAYELMIKLTSK